MSMHTTHDCDEASGKARSGGDDIDLDGRCDGPFRVAA